jgi:uncharacterized membrane protein YdjX (TVP38/TMEM64 family)
MSQQEKPDQGQPSEPVGLVAKVLDFINNMDARAWRALAVSVIMMAVVGVMIVLGRLFYGEEIAAFIDGTLGEAERAHLGLPVTILVFTLTAYVGAPQFVLIGACVVAFGPEVGFWYAWAATIVSGAATYFTGLLSSNETRRRFSGATGGRFTRFMGKNTFMASLVVRFVPTAPFVVVNMAFGAARANFWSFMGGLTLGVLPKTAIVAFGFDVIMDAIEDDLATTALRGAIAIALWFVGVVLIRRLLQNRMTQDANGEEGSSK